MPNMVRIKPTRPMNIRAAPDEGSSFLRVCHAVFRGCFEDGLARELVVDVVDAVEAGFAPRRLVADGLLAGVVDAVGVEDEGSAAGVDMVSVVQCGKRRLGFRDWIMEDKSLGQVLSERHHCGERQRPGIGEAED